MKISLNWLNDYLNTGLSPERVAEILTDTGLEVESVEKIETVKGGLEGVVIGKVLGKEKHPDADRLQVTKVDIGSGEILQIVCGAPNVDTGQKVAVAIVGTTLYPDGETALKIKRSKIRGIESAGMICAEDELGLGESHDGIMILHPESEIGTLAKDYFNIEDDHLLEIGLTPNRSDAMGHIGVARDLKAFLNFHENQQLQLNIPKIALPNQGNEAVNVQVEDNEACPRYAGAVITGVKIEPSPSWLQNRLRVIGLKPINNIVDITNYVMFETGNPLHAFDLGVVNGNVIVRKSKEGEKIVTLDETERTLNPNDLVICNSEGPMCIAGVFGGLHSGVKESTNSIFLESAFFNPVSVRTTAKRQSINTDSSFRFERGVDPNGVTYALERAVSLILEIAGGTLGKMEDVYPKAIVPVEIGFNPTRCRQLIGADISDQKIDTILKELDFSVTQNSGQNWQVAAPTYRADVTREADVIEEVLRIYGFNNVPIPEKLNTSITYKPDGNNELIYNMIANLLVDQGFYEIMNNSLTSSGIWKQIETASFDPNRDVKILNPLSNELDVMRQTLLFGGLKSIQYNQNRQNSNLKFFEFGNDYRYNHEKADRYPQRKKLSIWICGNQSTENWTHNDTPTDFYYLKGVVEAVLTKLGIFKKPVVAALLNDLFDGGINYAIAKRSVVDLGWIRQDILKAFDIKNDVFYASFDWRVIEDICIINKIKTKPIPKTQFVRRDFSLLLDQSVQFGDIRAIAQEVDQRLLKKIGLFDVYEGDKLPQGKKSYAVSFIFQDEEKTLKDQQIDAIMDKIRTKLEGGLGAVLR